MFAKSFCCRAGTAVRCSSIRGTMPLRAKITNPAFARKAEMSTASESERPPDKPRDRKSVPEEQPIKELKGDDPEDVLFNTLFGVRTIELNRPKALHSLNGSMIRKIVPRLQEWAKSDMANVVIIKGSGPKAFCAGGDVKHLAQDNMTGEEGQKRSTQYFELEYKLDHLIATYGKPYVAFLDGITMGGGVGLSIHAPFRIVTERTLFAMPETTIGFFPDVGASFFLPRMPGAVGTYLALTSERLKGVNAFYAGVGTHYIHSTSLPALERRLAELRFNDWQKLTERLEVIDSTIEEFCTGLPHDEPMLIQGELRNAIDRCFGQSSVPKIIAALQAETGEMQAWAEKTLATLHQRSPTSVYVTLRQMQLGQKWNISETFQREHQLAAKFMAHPDFTEGVRALLIDKDGKPSWQPASLEDIKPQDKFGEKVDEFFKVPEGTPRLRLLTAGVYEHYPHRHLNLPTEDTVYQVVKQGLASPKDIVRLFVSERKGKQGVREVVQEVLDRKTTINSEGKAVWISAPSEEEVVQPVAKEVSASVTEKAEGSPEEKVEESSEKAEESVQEGSAEPKNVE